MDILRVENVTKRFGSHTVFEGLSFSVPESSVFGFIGPNGAGKTTTMKLILGLLEADFGAVYVSGEKVCFGETKTNRHVGYLPDVPEFYGYMRPKEYLRLCGQVTGLSDDCLGERSQSLLSMVGLDGVNKKIGSFSRGMKQRLGIAQALLNEPKLLICDEPTSALDPVGRKEILDILVQVKGKTTVVFSTHILADVERICDRIAVLDKGRIVLFGTIGEIKAQRKTEGFAIEFRSERDKQAFIAEPRIKPFLSGQQQPGAAVTLRADDTAQAQGIALSALMELRLLPLVRLELLEPTIESLFMEVVA